MEWSSEEFARFGRQMILSDVGITGQSRLKAGKVAIIGCGGLGCPVALYLACAGIQYICIIDDDHVELSNLHRQVLHTSESIGTAKVISMKEQLLLRNPTMTIKHYNTTIRPDNALNLLSSCDVIVDCSDNAATRYLLNDIAVLTHKPLISGSAIGTSGQMSVFHYCQQNESVSPHNLPNNENQEKRDYSGCYRCIFPSASPIVQSCADNGVLGPVTGMIGSLQAMEVLKVLMNKSKYEVMCGRLLMVDLMLGMFRNVKFPRNVNCIACGDSPRISLYNLAEFIPSEACEDDTKQEEEEIENISPQQLNCLIQGKDTEIYTSCILLDVRNTTQFQICALPGSINIPLSEISKEKLNEIITSEKGEERNIYVICRRGIDSIKAVKKLSQNPVNAKIFNVSGGLLAWSRDVDPSFPVY